MLFKTIVKPVQLDDENNEYFTFCIQLISNRSKIRLERIIALYVAINYICYTACEIVTV